MTVKQQSKICTGCDILKNFDQFSKNKTRKDGLNGECKTCHTNYYKNNLEKMSTFNKKYKKDNAIKIVEWNTRKKIDLK